MDTEINGIEAILFDIDGTLSDSDDQIVEEIMRRIRFLRFLWKEKLLREIARSSVSLAMMFFNSSYHLVDRLGLDEFISKTFPRRRKRDREDFENDLSLIAGVEEMLRMIYQHYILGIVSARNEQGVHLFLEKFNLEKYFKVVVSAQTCYYTKPFPQPLLFAAETIKVLPGKCLMVGDTIVDILAGKAAGMRTAGVLCGFGTPKEFMRKPPDFILTSPADLISLLPKTSGKYK